jgi:hypothetical protein
MEASYRGSLGDGMTRGTGRDWRVIGCAAAVGAAVAFPAGLMLAGRDAPRHQEGKAARPNAPATKKADARDFYSPNISTDPYVLDQQRRVVEALELECRHFKKHCAEAGQARRRIEESAGD